MPRESLRPLVALLIGTSLLVTSAAVFARNIDAGTPVLMWEITRAEPDSGTLYLLGGTHVGRTAIEGFDELIEEAFARSQVLALEADVRVTDDPSFGQFILESGKLTSGATLAERIPAALYAQLSRTLKERRLLPDGFDVLEPWLVALMLSGDVLSKHGYRPRHGTARYFIDRDASKPLVELEGARFQIEALDRLDAELQEVMLEETLRGLETLDVRVQRILELWNAGDAEALARLLFGDEGATPVQQRYREKMYFLRNREMSERLEAPIRDGQRWFVVVGTGHVVGEQGIPELMSRRGYRVRQLRSHGSSAPVRRVAEGTP